MAVRKGNTAAPSAARRAVRTEFPAVGSDGVGFRIHCDGRHRVVEREIRLGDRAAVFHGDQSFRQTEFFQIAGFQGSRADEGDGGG